MSHIDLLFEMRTYCDVKEVKRKRAQHQVRTESGPDDQGYRQHKRREEVQQRLVDFLEDEDFGADFPEPELPGREDIAQIVEHSVHEEEVPAVEALFEDRHLAKTAASATA